MIERKKVFPKHLTYLHFVDNNNYNKIYREKSIPMTALWCPAFSYHG